MTEFLYIAGIDIASIANADALTRLNGATVDCLSDKKATLEAKKQRILDTYNDPATSVVDKYNLSEQLKDVNERVYPH